jgi:glycerol-3-phosphate cytidylyltransferase-like family protein
MLSIPPIDPGDHYIDIITRRTFDLLHPGHLNVLRAPASDG